MSQDTYTKVDELRGLVTEEFNPDEMAVFEEFEEALRAQILEQIARDGL